MGSGYQTQVLSTLEIAIFPACDEPFLEFGDRSERTLAIKISHCHFGAWRDGSQVKISRLTHLRKYLCCVYDISEVRSAGISYSCVETLEERLGPLKIPGPPQALILGFG